MEVVEKSTIEKIVRYLENKNLVESICTSLIIGLPVGLIVGLVAIWSHGLNIVSVAGFVFALMGLIVGFAVGIRIGLTAGLIAIPITILVAILSMSIVIGLAVLVELTTGIDFLFY